MSLPLGYEAPKVFEKRADVEGKKAKMLAEAMTQVKKQLENERKAFCVDFSKQFLAYQDSAKEIAPKYYQIVTEFSKRLEVLD